MNQPLAAARKYRKSIAAHAPTIGAHQVNSAYHRRVAFPSELGNSTSRQLQSTSPALVVPVGSTEQHGPHLPLDTDTRIATAVARAVADAARRPSMNPTGGRAGDRLRRQRRARGLRRHRLDRHIRAATCWWSSAGRPAAGRRASSSSTVTAATWMRWPRPRRCFGTRAATWAGARAARRTPTPMPATPKPLYCYIFRRMTSGSTSGSRQSGPAGRADARDASGGSRRRQRSGGARRPDDGDRGGGRAHLRRDGRRMFAARSTRWAPDREGMLR